MKRSALASSVAACICCGLAGPLLAATPVDQPPVTGTATRASPDAQTVAATAPAEKCLSDLRAFDTQMGKSGYWLGASGYGYGYPMGGFGYGYGDPMVGTPVGGVAAGGEIGYRTRVRATRSGRFSPPPTSSPRTASSSRARTCSPRPARSTNATWPICTRDGRASGGRAGLAEAADRRREAGHEQEHLVPVGRADRHRRARPAGRGSRQRRRHS